MIYVKLCQTLEVLLTPGRPSSCSYQLVYNNKFRLFQIALKLLNRREICEFVSLYCLPADRI